MWARLFIVANYIAWFILFVSLLVFHRAQPEFETVFDRFYQLNLRTYWDKAFLRYLVYVLAFGAVISLAGFGLGQFRARRKTDHRNAIIVLGILYLILFFVFQVLF